MSPKLENVLEQAKELTAVELRQLVALLNGLALGQQACNPEDKLDELLLRTGVISAIPPRHVNPVDYHQWTPITVEGKPLSETLIEERR